MLNNFVVPDFYPLAPEILLLSMSFVILLADLVLGKTQRWVAFALSIITLLGCAALTVMTADGQTALTMSNLFVDDLLSDFLKLMAYLSVIMVLVYGRQYLVVRGLDKGEF